MAYSELIKNFEKVRSYMRDYYVYGFKGRDNLSNEGKKEKSKYTFSLISASKSGRSALSNNNSFSLGNIYCESASRMFHCKVVKNGENSHLRQRGKVAELALGYGGSTGALVAMEATAMGIPEDELKPLVDAWREANPKIVEYWWAIDRAAKTAIRLRIPQHVGNVHFEMKSGVLFVILLSGRQLAYLKPRLEENQFGGESITYYGSDTQKHWCRVESWGPKIVENVTQAICRDLLAYAMQNLREYRIVAHVHDEVVLEVPVDTSMEKACEIMGQSPPWLPCIELRADGFEAQFYEK